MATDKNPQQTRKLSFEAGLVARLMRQNLMMFGTKLFENLPPWVHAMEWMKGAPDDDDLLSHGAVLGATVVGALSPVNGQLQFYVCNSTDDEARKKFVMWAPLSVDMYQGPMPLWLQFKPNP